MGLKREEKLNIK